MSGRLKATHVMISSAAAAIFRQDDALRLIERTVTPLDLIATPLE
jgi:hypothetical protein